MKQDKYEKLFRDIGLTENEAKVYLASLSLGSATVLQLSRTAEVKRTTVYSVIDSLKQKGLMKVEVHGLKQRYAPADPVKLQEVLEKQKETLSQQLPELSALYNLTGSESYIKYYEGLDAVKSVYDMLLHDVRPGDDYLVISDTKKWRALDSKYFFEDFRKRRTKLRVNTRLLLQDSPDAREQQKYALNFAEQVRILPQGTALSTNLNVTPQHVMIHQLTPPTLAIVIDNASVVQMHREMFEIMWFSTVKK